MSELLGQMRPKFYVEPGSEHGDVTYESEEDRLEREVRDISNYLESLKSRYRELTGEEIVDSD